MFAIIVGVVVAIGVIAYGTRSQGQDQQIIKDIKYDKDKMKGNTTDIDDEDFVEILNCIERKDNKEVKRRFNQITNPEKRKKIKLMLKDQYDNGKNKGKRNFEDVEFDVEQTNEDITSRHACRLL